jgi:hypothetical protein
VVLIGVVPTATTSMQQCTLVAEIPLCRLVSITTVTAFTAGHKMALDGKICCARLSRLALRFWVILLVCDRPTVCISSDTTHRGGTAMRSCTFPCAARVYHGQRDLQDHIHTLASNACQRIRLARNERHNRVQYQELDRQAHWAGCQLVLEDSRAQSMLSP